MMSGIHVEKGKKEFQVLLDVIRGLGLLVTAVGTWELCRK